MVVQHNLSALFASNQLNQISGQQQKSTEKLSSGYRINRAADDAAGLSISEKMRRQIRGLNRAAQNTQDGISFCQVADGALGEIQAMMQRMTELCVQAANGTNSPEDRAAINHEIQQLKLEMTRTFDSTDFNNHKIWHTDLTARKEIPNTSQYVLNNATTVNSVTVTNDNVGTVSQTNSYSVSADTTTITIDWTGLDGGKYQATYPFADFKGTGTFDLSNAKKLDGTGTYQPLSTAEMVPFQFKYDFAPHSTDEEIAAALDGMNVFSGSLYTPLSLSPNSGLSLGSMSIAIGATYQSHIQSNDDNDSVAGVDYTNYQTSALTPLNGGANITVGADSDSSQWTFQFSSEDYGTLTAKATSLYAYTGNFSGDKDKYWYTDSNGVSHPKTQYASTSSNTGVADLLTGPNGLQTAGVSSGTITLGFTLYDMNNNSIGNFHMSTAYRAGDNPDTIADRFRNSLSTGATLTPGTMNMSLSSSMPSYGNGKQIPEYESMLGMTIQTGDVAGDEVEIIYKSLSIATLGLNTLDTLTETSAKDGLGKVSRALDMISEQRSTFGAYQNRLEHTYNNDTNTAENVQASESRIRDTDMPEEMMQLSVQNILAQAGQSMLGQAMHDKDYIMNLLQ